jgi:hypothetical protein
MDRRLPRRQRPHRPALLIAALVLAAPGLSACSFNYATDRENTIINGVSNQDGTVNVLNAMIVSSEPGSGTFIASLANTDPTSTSTPFGDLASHTISLESLDFGANTTIESAAFDPIEIVGHGLVNLSDGQGIKVSGDFEAGDFVSLTLVFDNGQSIPMEIPVNSADDEYTGLDNGTGVPEPAATESAG